MAILCENAHVVTLDQQKPVLHGQQILIDQGIIADIGNRVKIRNSAVTKRMDCSGKIVMPGLINTHSHLTEILQRSFRDNVRMEIWKGYRARTEEMADPTAVEIGIAAELACAEMLKSGVTAVVDHFSTRPGLSVPKMKAIISAFEKTGIRGVLAPSLSDQDLLRILTVESGNGKTLSQNTDLSWKEQILEILDYLRTSCRTSGLILGPSSPFNCSDFLLREIVRFAAKHDLGIHTHLLETRLQRWAAGKLYRRGLGERLRRLGFLSSRLSAAHCVWLNDKEIDLMASSHASAVHNPASNLKLGSGIAPVVALKKRGVNVALGTDGGDTSDSYSIFEQMRLAAFLSRVATERAEDWVTSSEALRMGTLNGAEAIPLWRGKIGKIKKGYRADLLILKPHLRLRPLRNIVSQLIFCEGGHSVDTVLVDGRVVVRGGRLTRVREETLVSKVEPISEKMRKLYARIEREAPDKSELEITKLYKRAFKEERHLDRVNRGSSYC
jgi:5-methylthioadenosine/S-adenosylhomocysteine deaminase